MVKCGACGVEGHNRSNKKCRLYVTLKNREIEALKKSNQLLQYIIKESNDALINMAIHIEQMDQERLRSVGMTDSSIVVPRQNDKTDAVRRIGDLIDDHADSMPSEVYKKLLEACALEFNN
jgi:hypothetical protein